jgi:hypothetical protein
VLVWCQNHFQIFLDNYEEIGLTQDQANAFKSSTLDCASAATQQEVARQAAENATANFGDKYRVMRGNMTRAISAIRSHAEETDNPAVLITAQVPARQDPSTLPPPGQPSNLTVDLISPSGALQLRWRANNPRGAQGTSYIVRRKLPSETAFSFIGVTGEKRFVDNGFTAGPDSVQYTVQGQRADSAGPESEIFTVRFGRQGPGITILSSGTGTGNVKLAA